MNKDPSDNSFAAMIRCPRKKIDKATAPLAKILRKIIHTRIHNESQWNKLLNNYFNDPNNDRGKDSVGRSTDKARTHTQLANGDNMTWKVFMLGIRILAPVKITLIAKIQWSNNENDITTHDAEITIKGNRSNVED